MFKLLNLLVYSIVNKQNNTKKKAQYGKSVQVFQDRLRKTKETLNATVADEESSSEFR